MTYQTFIDDLRLAVGDLETLTQDKWDGDAATTLFRSSHRPILDDSYEVSISDVLKTETTDYTLNKDTGILEFVSAPASGTKNVKNNYKYAFLRDDEYITIINDVLKRWRRKIWVESVNETTFNSVADADEYDLDSISTNIIWLINGWFKTSSATEWVAIGRDRNWEYWPESNKIILRPSFATADYDLRLHYLATYNLGSTVGSTFEPNAKFHSAIRKACLAEYWERFASYLLRNTESFSKEMTFHPASEIMKQALQLRKLADVELALIKPRYPESQIRNVIGGITS